MSDVIRIAQVVGKMKGGGVEAMVMNYFRHMEHDRISFDFIIDSDSTIVPRKEIEHLGGRIFEIAPYQKPIQYQRDLTALFEREKYQIVHSHINAMSIFPLRAAQKAGVPVRIAHSHSTSGRGEIAKNIVKSMLKQFSRTYPTHLFACSGFAGEWLFGHKALADKQIRVVKNAIDKEKFLYREHFRRAMQERLGLENKLVIGHVGRFMTQKNHMFLIEIFHELLKLRKDAVLLLVGDGELIEDVKSNVLALGVEKSVRFLGVVDDVENFMQVMDILLLPSLYEGLGIVAVEAQAIGLKVIASDAVPSEAVLTDIMHRISLDKSPRFWAEYILAESEYDRISRQDDIVENGYDIVSVAGELEAFYYQAAFENMPAYT